MKASSAASVLEHQASVLRSLALLDAFDEKTAHKLSKLGSKLSELAGSSHRSDEDDSEGEPGPFRGKKQQKKNQSSSFRGRNSKKTSKTTSKQQTSSVRTRSQMKAKRAASSTKKSRKEKAKYKDDQDRSSDDE